MNNYSGKLNKSGAGNNKNMELIVSERIRLMDFLISQLPHKSRNNIKSLLGYQQVFVDGKNVTKFNFQLVPGQKVEIGSNRVSPGQKFREYNLIYEDQYLIVIDKAAGLLSIATETEKRVTAFSLLSRHVKRQHPENKIFIVHRLDRDTSGLMLFAKNEEVKEKLQETWNDTVTERTYIAVVEGIVRNQSGTVTSYLSEDRNFKMHSASNPEGGRKAVTHYSVIRQNESYSLLKVTLETGRKNQIRIHMQELGHCIAGDRKYGALSNPLRRLGLHARQLSFIHPVTGQKLEFETKIPGSFLRLF